MRSIQQQLNEHISKHPEFLNNIAIHGDTDLEKDNLVSYGYFDRFTEEHMQGKNIMMGQEIFNGHTREFVTYKATLYTNTGRTIETAQTVFKRTITSSHDDWVSCGTKIAGYLGYAMHFDLNTSFMKQYDHDMLFRLFTEGSIVFGDETRYCWLNDDVKITKIVLGW